MVRVEYVLNLFQGDDCFSGAAVGNIGPTTIGPRKEGSHVTQDLATIGDKAFYPVRFHRTLRVIAKCKFTMAISALYRRLNINADIRRGVSVDSRQVVHFSGKLRTSIKGGQEEKVLTSALESELPVRLC